MTSLARTGRPKGQPGAVGAAGDGPEVPVERLERVLLHHRGLGSRLRAELRRDCHTLIERRADGDADADHPSCLEKAGDALQQLRARLELLEVHRPVDLLDFGDDDHVQHALTRHLGGDTRDSGQFRCRLAGELFVVLRR